MFDLDLLALRSVHIVLFVGVVFPYDLGLVVGAVILCAKRITTFIIITSSLVISYTYGERR